MKCTAYYDSFIYQLRIYLLSPLLNKRNRSFNLIQLFMLLFIISLILILLFEFYYQYGHCAVSREYSNKNIKLIHKVIDMLDNLSIPYWIDSQSLLNVLRNETFNVWDHDVDLSIEWPLTSNRSHSEFSNREILMKKIEKYGFRIDFLPNRKLFQFQFQDDISQDKSHVDIWLWTRKYIHHHSGNNYQTKNDEKKIILEHLDYSIKYKSRLISHIYPLKYSTWLGRNITIPFDSHAISYEEYGASYMKAIVFRKNCIHNLFYGRWM